MKKRLLIGALLVCLMIFAAVSVPAVYAAEAGSCGDNLSWSLDDTGTLTVSGTGDMTDYSTDNRAPWYASRERIVRIVVEEGVTSVGKFAFYYCSKATQLDIADTVTHIGDQAFSSCGSLERVELPEALESVGVFAFSECSKLQYVSVPGSLESIGGGMFAYCKKLTQIDIADGVKTVGDSAFSYCEALIQVEFPQSVTAIGESAFRACKALQRMVIPAQVTRIESHTFTDCFKLKEVVFPEGLTYIGNMAFYSCSDLQYVEFPDSLTYLGVGAFEDCHDLKYAVIPGGVSEVQTNAFNYCTSLNAVVFKEGVTTIGVSVFERCENLTSVTFPSTLTTIRTDAFDRCEIESIYISDVAAWCRVKFGDDLANPLQYGPAMYLNGELITDLVIPEGVESIADMAFYRCRSLESVTFPESLKSIGNKSFYECYGLKEVTLPKNITQVGKSAFGGCAGLEKLTVEEGVTGLGDGAFVHCVNLKQVSLPGTLAELPDSLFGNAESLREITIPEGVTTVGSGTFAGAISLEKMILPVSLEGIYRDNFPVAAVKMFCYQGSRAQWLQMDLDVGFLALLYTDQIWYCHDGMQWNFRETDGTLTVLADGQLPDFDQAPWSEYKDQITYICIGENVTGLGKNCFAGCTKVKSVFVGAQVTQIADTAFSGISRLKIHGVQGSAAQAFAKARGLSFSDKHDYQFVETVAAGCETEGYDRYRCVCGMEDHRNVTSKLGHNPVMTFKITPACAKDKLVPFTPCNRCNKTAVPQEVIRACGHELTVVSVLKQVTAETDGWLEQKCNVCGKVVVTRQPASDNPFTDLDTKKYYYDAVLWAVEEGITKGTTATTFSPDKSCTRGQVVMFLWRAAGQPEPESMDCPFTDVKPNDQFKKAIMWALENGITKGKTATTFEINSPCTRKQIVTFLYRYYREPALAASQRENPFTDVKDDSFKNAILWAYYNGITTGKTATTFQPEEPCLRGQIVTFLYRAKDMPKASKDTAQILEDAYALKYNTALPYCATLTGTVRKINIPWDQEPGTVTVTIAVEGYKNSPIVCDKFSGEAAAQLALGDTVTVSGILENQNGTVQFRSDSVVEAVKKHDGSPFTDPDLILEAAKALEIGETLPYEVTLTGRVYNILEQWTDSNSGAALDIEIPGCEWAEVTCEGLVGEGAKNVRAGDVLVVTGTLRKTASCFVFEAGSTCEKE